MHHLVLDHWSRGHSWLHRLDARAKIVCALVFLVLISTAPTDASWFYAADLALLVTLILSAGLPPGQLLLRSAVVLPLSLTFAAMVALGGETQKAVALLVRTYLSAAAALLLVATTPLPELLDGLRRLGVPRMIILTAQFLYRYLFVLAEQAQHMRIAATSRSGGAASRKLRFRGAAGMLGILFARSYARADGIYQAMLARGFDGSFRLLAPARLRAGDVLAAAVFVSLCGLLRWSLIPR